MARICCTSSGASVKILEGKLHAELRRITLERAPGEAVGLILSDDRIIELPNRAESPEAQFVTSRDDIIAALDDELQLEDVVFWHSHPGGGIGPSRIDMQQRTLFHNHLVVALVDGDIIPAWY